MAASRAPWVSRIGPIHANYKMNASMAIEPYKPEIKNGITLGLKAPWNNQVIIF